MLTSISSNENVIEGERSHIVQTYNRPPFVLMGGKGVTVYDADGNSYTDWVSGIAVNSLGYGDAELTKAIGQAINTGLIHTSHLYHTVPHVDLATILCESSFADRVFFCNSGTEAVEGAIKFARRVAYNKGLTHKTEIVGCSGAFHGRTMGSLALTPRDHFQEQFKPLMPSTAQIEFNNLESARVAIGENTAAVIVEPVQGHGGIHVATNEFLRCLRELCDEYDAMLIIDEVQCGLGRTGKLWAYEWSGVTPDMMTLAKPLAGGLPMGAILVTNEVGDNIKPGDHCSTFAGGPVVSSAAKVVVNRVTQPQFLEHVSEVGQYLVERLMEIDSPLIKDIRGQGLMIGLELTIEAIQLVNAAHDYGLLLVGAGSHVIRLVPPLIIDKRHVDHLVDCLTEILRDFE
jgi:acetylornithine/N-succinyldiaminopimelate aminotransferase